MAPYCFEKVLFGSDEIFCDVEGTRRLYQGLHPIEDSESRLYLNLTRQRAEIFGEPARALLGAFGIDHCCEMHFGYLGRRADPKFPELHLYNFDFSFIGTWPPRIAVRGGHDPEFLMGPEIELTPHQKAALTTGVGGMPRDFRGHPLLTIQLWFVVPWVLDPALLEEMGI